MLICYILLSVVMVELLIFPKCYILNLTVFIRNAFCFFMIERLGERESWAIITMECVTLFGG